MYKVNATMSETEVNTVMGSAIAFLGSSIAILSSTSPTIDQIAGAVALGSFSIIGYVAYVFSKRAEAKNIENIEKFKELSSQVEVLRASVNAIATKIND